MSNNLFKENLEALLARAMELRQKNFGDTVTLRVAHNYYVANRCSADCAFCTWSSVAKDDYAEKRGLSTKDGEIGLDEGSLNSVTELANSYGAELEIISNAERVNNNVCEKFLGVIGQISQRVQLGIQPGIINNPDHIKALRDAGIDYYCNDLETSPSYFPEICTTHTIQEKIDSLNMAKKRGIKIWSGFCMGIGESEEQRIEVIENLKRLSVDGVILNFFYQTPGIPLYEKVKPLTPEEYLKTIAVVRIAMPDIPIIIGGGRKTNLKNLMPRIYEAGASGIYLGTFLNHPRPSISEDLKIIEKSGLKIVKLSKYSENENQKEIPTEKNLSLVRI